ncbi:phage baseplate plug family protein [Klebsiella variicola]|uniref:phage baseplate plug family protein n=1 Tax=Klebsiella variicola TaxID=244366 RepID=UPI000C9C6A13
MQEISLHAQTSQTFTVDLGGQSCQIRIVQRSTGIYMDLYVNNAPVVQGVLCINCVKLVRYSYLGFSGDLVIVDTQGETDPFYDELGSRYRLYYLSQDDLA